MFEKIILIRHGEYSGIGDVGLNREGKERSVKIAEKIAEIIKGDTIGIWSSTANRSKDTAEIIMLQLNAYSIKWKEKLWSDDNHKEDFRWLLEEIKKIRMNNDNWLIIVSHLEYVNDFPRKLGHKEIIHAGKSEGIVINDNTIEKISWKDSNSLDW